MMYRETVALFALCALGSAPPRPVVAKRIAVERITTNDNRAPAGSLAGGVLTIRLEARAGEWHPDRDADPGLVVQAFAEQGRAPQIPGPLLRVPRGTVIHAFVRNTLADSTLVVHGLSARGSHVGSDTLQIRPGQVRETQFVADVPGTYYYWGTTNRAATVERAAIESQLSGAFIVDAPGAQAVDRVLVIGLWSTAVRPGGVIAKDDLLRFVINGRSWPNTERLTYDVGDSMRFRIVNPTGAVHPMHLHGFYFNVDSRGDERTERAYSATGSRHLVVTERVPPGGTFTLTWVPDRPGNWLFHCHDNFHLLRNRPLDGTPLTDARMLHVTNHALEMMNGLVMGIEVRPGRAITPPETGVRRALRLLARVDENAGGTPDEPAFGYVLQGGAQHATSSAPLLPGPTIVLTRGQPVGITVVNELPEPTAVHWHGIELESYYDGVAGFSGRPGRIAPVIAPRDSFEARFTPPRAGTFIYHPHADEVRQLQAGLSGALIVLEPGATFDPQTDVVVLVTVPRREADARAVFLNGTSTPVVRDLRVGQRYRLRLINITTSRPSIIVRLVRDTTTLTWRAIAKDGMDLPADQATTQPAMVQFGNGETYDFEFVPTTPGDVRLALTSAVGVALGSMPFRVR